MGNTAKSNKIAVLAISLAVCLITIGALFFLYYQKHIEANSLSSEVGSLKKSEASHAASTEKATKQPADETVQNKLVYTAKVGKFTLKLPSDYGIVQHIDGVGISDARTKINIGKKVENKDDVIEVASQMPFEIDVMKSPAGETLDSAVTKALEGSTAISNTPTTVAREPGKVLTLGGIGPYKKVVFLHSGLRYAITYDTEDPQGEQTYKDFLKGFSFS